jgi:hypothetical protein
MKNFIFYSFIWFVSFQLSWGQLQVEIGNDTTFCPENLSTGIRLAPHLTVNGGVEPYEYAWSIREPYEYLPGKFYYAAGMLNDTALANPVFTTNYIGLPNSWNQFILTVKDSRGDVIRDTIRVRFSEFYARTSISPVYLYEGDSILLDMTDEDWGGIMPYSRYSWLPEEGLSTPNSSKTWCKPGKSTTYYCLITDSSGCKGYGNEYMIILQSMTPISRTKGERKLYQWQETIYFDNPENKEITVSFYDSSGKLLHKAVTKSNNYKPLFRKKNEVLFCTVTGYNQKTLKYIIQ